MAAQLSENQRLGIRLAIEDLNAEFVHRLDHGASDELAELFCEDAIYTHGERRSEGRLEIAELFRRRLDGGPRTSRHIYSGLRIAILSQTQATGTSVCLTFAADGLPPLPATPLLVADFVDRYRLSADGQWRFSERHIHRIFTAPDNPGPVGLERGGRAR